MEKIKFSIIIPMYNIQDYIEKCINSILQQEYKNYEIIVVNDGSTDNSYKIVENIQDERIKIISKENGGLSSARNEGLKYAQGDYIWFIDGDDYIEPSALLKIAKEIENEDYDVICFQHYKEYEDKKIVVEDKIDWNEINQRPLINTSAWGKVFNRNFFVNNNYKFTEGIIYEDLALIPYVMVKASKIKYIKTPLYNYVYRNNSIMNQKKVFKKNRDDKFKAIDTLYNYFNEEDTIKKYSEELEFLVIRHLLMVYSTEILPFNASIYKIRCKNVLQYLKNINIEWNKNKYLKEKPKATRIYVWLFKMRLFRICKICLKMKKNI